MPRKTLDIKIRTNQMRFISKLFKEYSDKGFYNEMDRIAQYSLNILTEEVKLFMPASHRLATRNFGASQRRLETSTGRLWSGWGVRKGPIVQIHESMPPSWRHNAALSGPADNIAEIRKRRTKGGASYSIIAGTTIRYAPYVNEGRPRSPSRPIYDFIDQGFAEAEAEIVDYAIELLSSSIDSLERRFRQKSFIAQGRTRDKFGRFMKENTNGIKFSGF